MPGRAVAYAIVRRWVRFQWVSTYGYGALFVLLMLGIVGLRSPVKLFWSFAATLISRGTLDNSDTGTAV
jgi:hypothetical protein